MQITLTLSNAPRQVQEWTLEVPESCTLAAALKQVDWQARCPGLDLDAFEASIWGRRAEGRTHLKAGDRVELTRALRVDPKVARRERFQRQGVRTAGLFARRSPR